MSWSFSAIGKPENIVKAMQEYAAKLDGQSKVEFDEALPHLSGLVMANLHDPTYGGPGLVQISASGSGVFRTKATPEGGTETTKTSGSCIVKIEPLYANLV